MVADQGEGEEPDYRFTLANERTFLAWMRTSLALLAAGVAARELAEPFGVRGIRTALALTALVLSLTLAVASYVRWAQVQRAMQRGAPLPRPLAIPVLATGITVVSGAVAVLLVVR